MRYTIKIVAQSCPCPITGKTLPALTDIVTVTAASSTEAARKAARAMTISPRGQTLRYYHGTVEVFSF